MKGDIMSDRRTWKNLNEVRRANGEWGKANLGREAWFAPSVMRYWGTTIVALPGTAEDILNKRYFVTCDQPDYMPDCDCGFTVRVVHDDGQVQTVGTFRQYKTVEDAVQAIMKLP